MCKGVYLHQAVLWLGVREQMRCRSSDSVPERAPGRRKVIPRLSDGKLVFEGKPEKNCCFIMDIFQLHGMEIILKQVELGNGYFMDAAKTV